MTQAMTAAQDMEAIKRRMEANSSPLVEGISILFRGVPEWTVAEISELMNSKTPGRFTTKQIYNAIGYLRREGRITKIGYGRYRANPSIHVLSDLAACVARIADLEKQLAEARAQEREACAKVAEEIADRHSRGTDADSASLERECRWVARRIREDRE